MFRKKVSSILCLVVMLVVWSVPSAFASATGDYEKVSQAALSKKLEKYRDKKIAVEGSFLFTGSDFCYQIRKTKINTKDYLCFALGPVSVVRLYLKKDHEQVPLLMSVKKGQKVKAYGTYDFLGADYKYIVVDRIELE